jgi:hypothetical protein
MNRTIVLALPVIAGLLLFGCSRQAAQPSAQSGTQAVAAQTRNAEQAHAVSNAELPDWSLSEADSTSLGSPYRMSSFEIRPPANFRFIKYLPEEKSYYWVGPVRADETYPQFFVTITELSGSDTNASLAASLSEIMDAVKQRRTDWSQTPAEQGKINGLPFIRSSWSGVASSAARKGLSGRAMHGTVYLTVHDNRAVQIMCQDVAPDHGEWLRLGGFAASTFRLAPAESAAP